MKWPNPASPVKLEEWKGCVGEGWADILEDLWNKAVWIEAQFPAVELHINQIKEKFGGLRFYYGWGPSDKAVGGDWDVSADIPVSMFTDAVWRAESKASHTCEDCGKDGTLRDERSSWWATLCDDCLAAREGDKRAALEEANGA